MRSPSQVLRVAKVKRDKFVKRIIKHKSTDQYYAGEGKWVTDVHQAKDFLTVWAVVEEARKYDLKGCCVLLLQFDGRQFDIELTL